MAFGVQGLGGAANNFASYYGVADYEFDFLPVRLSAGYGEYDNSEFNAAVKLHTPKNTLPFDSEISAL